MNEMWVVLGALALAVVAGLRGEWGCATASVMLANLGVLMNIRRLLGERLR